MALRACFAKPDASGNCIPGAFAADQIRVQLLDAFREVLQLLVEHFLLLLREISWGRNTSAAFRQVIDFASGFE